MKLLFFAIGALAAFGYTSSASAQEIDYNRDFTFSTPDGKVSCVAVSWLGPTVDEAEVRCTGINGMGANQSASCTVTLCRRVNHVFGGDGYQSWDPKPADTVIGDNTTPLRCSVHANYISCRGPAGRFAVSAWGVVSVNGTAYQ